MCHCIRIAVQPAVMYAVLPPHMMPCLVGDITTGSAVLWRVAVVFMLIGMTNIGTCFSRAIGGNDIVSIPGTFVRTVAGEPVVGVAV